MATQQGNQKMLTAVRQIVGEWQLMPEGTVPAVPLESSREALHGIRQIVANWHFSLYGHAPWVHIVDREMKNGLLVGSHEAMSQIAKVLGVDVAERSEHDNQRLKSQKSMFQIENVLGMDTVPAKRPRVHRQVSSSAQLPQL